MALRSALLVVVAVGLSSQVASAECSKNTAGAAFATGTGKADAKADSPAKRRLFAEKAAYMEALKGLKACLGDEEASKIGGWTISEVRYFDSDPIVEVDIAALPANADRVAVIGSGLPDLKNAAAGVKGVRIGAERAAKLSAMANAKAALAKAFPSGKEGEARHTFEGMLTGCVATNVAYWDDQSVTLKLECGKDVPKEAAKAAPAPALEKHAAK